MQVSVLFFNCCLLLYVTNVKVIIQKYSRLASHCQNMSRSSINIQGQLHIARTCLSRSFRNIQDQLHIAKTCLSRSSRNIQDQLHIARICLSRSSSNNQDQPHIARTCSHATHFLKIGELLQTEEYELYYLWFQVHIII